MCPVRKGSEGLPVVDVYKDEHGTPREIKLDGKTIDYVSEVGWKFSVKDGVPLVTLHFWADLQIHEHEEGG